VLKAFTIAAAGLVFCAMMYLWWRLVLIAHDLRSKVMGKPEPPTTLFTYRAKRQ
jgi:hypothetical protein